MMQVSLPEITETFQNVLNGYVSRQQARQWAEERMHAYHEGQLEFSPVEEEDKLLDALLYMEEVETKTESNQWQHDRGEILNYCNRNDLLELH